MKHWKEILLKRVILLVFFSAIIFCGVCFAQFVGNRVIFASTEDLTRWDIAFLYEFVSRTTTWIVTVVTLYFLLSFVCSEKEDNVRNDSAIASCHRRLLCFMPISLILNMAVLITYWQYLKKLNPQNQLEMLPVSAVYNTSQTQGLAAIVACMDILVILFNILGVPAFVIPYAKLEEIDAKIEIEGDDDYIDIHDRIFAEKFRSALSQFRSSLAADQNNPETIPFYQRSAEDTINPQPPLESGMTREHPVRYCPDTRLRRSFLNLWRLMSFEPITDMAAIAPLRRQLIVVTMLCLMIAASYVISIFYSVSWPIILGCNALLICYVTIEAINVGRKHPAIICLTLCVYFVTLPAFLTRTLAFFLNIVSSNTDLSAWLKTVYITVIVILFQLAGSLMYFIVGLLLRSSLNYKHRFQLPFYFHFGTFKYFMLKTVVFSVGNLQSGQFWAVLGVDALWTLFSSSELATRFISAVLKLSDSRVDREDWSKPNATANGAAANGAAAAVAAATPDAIANEGANQDGNENATEDNMLLPINEDAKTIPPELTFAERVLIEWNEYEKTQYTALWIQRLVCQLLGLVLVPLLFGVDIWLNESSELVGFIQDQFESIWYIGAYCVVAVVLVVSVLIAWLIDRLALPPLQKRYPVEKRPMNGQILYWASWRGSLWYAASLFLAIIVCLDYFYQRVQLEEE